MGTTELILAVVLLLILFGAGILMSPMVRTPGQAFTEFQLWVAQGCGAGRVPFAPGTVGSVIGLVWFALLLMSGSLWLFTGGTLAGLVLSIRWCDVAEKLLGRKDPGSVVLDEITAMPLCFLAWVWLATRHTGSFPQVDYFVSKRHWFLTLAIFAAFRLFDIWKPWPARQSQALRGGWGITVDDAIAAVYVNVLVLLIYGGKTLLN